MKAIKIILVVAVLTAIIYFICKWYNGIICPPPTTKPTNESIDSIQSRIKNLDSKPAHMFCQDYYNKVQWEIDYAYKNGLLGKHYQNINKEAWHFAKPKCQAFQLIRLRKKILNVFIFFK